MSKPRVMPIAENRQRALDYWVRFTKSDHIVNVRKDRIAKEAAHFKAKDLPGEVVATLAASTLGGFRMANAVDLLIAGKGDGWGELLEALAVGYMGSELCRHRREIQPQAYCRRTVDDLYYIAFHAALSGLGLWPQADCLNRQLMNLWVAGGIDLALDEQQDFLGFYWFLMRAQYKGEWPDLAQLDAAELGEFYPLYATVAKPEAFRKALVQYCDFRLARMHEYPSQHATRRYPELHTDALTYGSMLLFPAELLAFKAIYEGTTGRHCMLDGDHPLLNTAAMKPPSGAVLPSNDIAARANEVGKATFGGAWKPGSLVEVRFDQPPTLIAEGASGI